VPRSVWHERADELDAALARGAIGEAEWFAGMRALFGAAYLECDDPRGQSGFGGDEARWEAARRPIVEAIDRPGSFLDVGCASGHLMESVVRWSPFAVEPHGLDLAPELVALARARLPQWARRIHEGNALDWQPPQRYDFVRCELVYVPEPRWADLVARLLGDVVAPGGRLILCGYGSPRSGMPPHPVRRIARKLGYDPDFELTAEAPEGGPLTEICSFRRLRSLRYEHDLTES
jgi:SAM-dependent methyltransferase